MVYLNEKVKKYIEGKASCVGDVGWGSELKKKNHISRK